MHLGVTVTHETAVTTPKLELRFAWGAERIEDRLPVGRDPAFSPLAAKLACYDTVSRRHAEILVKEGVACVIHIGSTNPTYLNGNPLPRGQPAPLGNGDILRFSASVRAVVRVTT